MARTITWKNDDNATCKLTIQDGSNTEVALTPAAEPFTTAMQETDDLFTPIRTSSGYANVLVDSVDDIAALVGSSPLARKVVLTVDGSTRWVGFLACETFSQSWDKGPIEIEMPVMSPIEMLRGLHPSASLSALKYINFAQLLVDINTAVGNSFEQFYFPALSNVGTTLKYQFDMKNYATATEHNTEHEMASYYEILEDVCKLFGWQCIEYGSYLVFLAADVKVFETGMNNVYQGFSLNNIRQIAAGQSVSPAYRPAFTAVIPTIDGADHSQTWIAGKKSVEVSGDLNERSETIWEMDIVEQCRYTGSMDFQTVGTLQYHYHIKKYGVRQDEGETTPIGNIQSFNSVMGMATPDTQGNNIKFLNNRDGTVRYGGSVAYERTYWTDEHGVLTDGNNDWKRRLIMRANQSSAYVAFHIYTNFFYSPTQNMAVDGFIISGDVLFADVAQDMFEPDAGTHYIRANMKVGNYFWNPNTNSWSTTSAGFLIRVVDGKITDYGFVNSPLLGFYQYIAAPNVEGEVELILYASKDAGGQAWPGDSYIAIEGLDIQLVAQNRVAGRRNDKKIEEAEQRENENVKKINLNNGFTESWSQDCRLTLARENVPDSYGVVLSAVKGRPTDLYGNTWPENALAIRVSDYYTRARIKIKAMVHSTNILLSPFVPYTFVSGGKPYICIEQKMNWKTNELTGGFFEPTYNS